VVFVLYSGKQIKNIVDITDLVKRPPRPAGTPPQEENHTELKNHTIPMI